MSFFLLTTHYLSCFIILTCHHNNWGTPRNCMDCIQRFFYLVMSGNDVGLASGKLT